jgi:hypothetical protein
MHNKYPHSHLIIVLAIMVASLACVDMLDNAKSAKGVEREFAAQKSFEERGFIEMNTIMADGKNASTPFIDYRASVATIRDGQINEKDSWVPIARDINPVYPDKISFPMLVAGHAGEANIIPYVFEPVAVVTPAPDSERVGDLLLQDEFEINSGNWGEYQDDNWSALVKDGSLHLEIHDQVTAAWIHHEASLSDFDLQVDASQLSGAENAYGVAFRMKDPENMYAFLINGDGFYNFYKVVQGEMTGILPWVESDVIRHSKSINNIRIRAMGEQFFFFVNDQLINQVTDESLSIGHIAMMAATYYGSEVEFEFDNLKVFDVSQQEEESSITLTEYVHHDNTFHISIPEDWEMGYDELREDGPLVVGFSPESQDTMLIASITDAGFELTELEQENTKEYFSERQMNSYAEHEFHSKLTQANGARMWEYSIVTENGKAYHVVTFSNMTGTVFWILTFLAEETVWEDWQTTFIEMAESFEIGDSNVNNSLSFFQDDFSDPASGWPIYKGAYVNQGYQDGKYRIELSEPNHSAWGTEGSIFDDVFIEVNAGQVEGNHDSQYGVICRFQDYGNFYGFAIRNDGYYTIWKVEAEEIIGLVEWTPSPIINQGLNVNLITVVCDGYRLALTINGELLAEKTDSSISRGLVGVYAGAMDAPGVVVEFDNFVVREP